MSVVRRNVRRRPFSLSFHFFFFNDTATTEIYTLSLHDALPICSGHAQGDASPRAALPPRRPSQSRDTDTARPRRRSEEHTSELQSQSNLVCRLLLEKKKKIVKEVISGALNFRTEHKTNGAVQRV